MRLSARHKTLARSAPGGVAGGSVASVTTGADILIINTSPATAVNRLVNLIGAWLRLHLLGTSILPPSLSFSLLPRCLSRLVSSCHPLPSPPSIPRDRVSTRGSLCVRATLLVVTSRCSCRQPASFGALSRSVRSSSLDRRRRRARITRDGRWRPRKSIMILSLGKYVPVMV